MSARCQPKSVLTHPFTVNTHRQIKMRCGKITRSLDHME